MRRLVLTVVAVMMVMSGCSNDELLRSPTADEELQILVSAVKESCEVERRCSTARPIKLIDQSPRAGELQEQLPGYQIETISGIESRALEADDESGQIKDGATIMRIFGPREASPGVITVEVQTSTGNVNDYRAEALVYQLQNLGWVRVAAESVGVTITSSVS